MQTRVSVPPSDVFAVLSNGWLYPGWVVGASRMRQVDESWPEVGSKLYHSVGNWPLLLDDTTSVHECVPDRRLVLRARAWPGGEATVIVELEPDGDSGTRVSISEDVVEGPAKMIIGPVRRVLLRFRNRESLRRLRFLAEGGAEAARESS